jgi:hypothetical protein
LISGKDSVPETVHHVVVEVLPERYRALLGGERAKLVSTDGVHTSGARDKEAASEAVKR